MKPITFREAMACGVERGAKTQTRRLIDPQPRVNFPPTPHRAPHAVGDRLWGRTEWWRERGKDYDNAAFQNGLIVSCTHAGIVSRHVVPTWRPTNKKIWWRRSAMVLPRWAARFVIEVKDVRAERLDSISLDDVFAELGETKEEAARNHGESWEPYDAFQALWDSIHGKTAPYASNPWVWRYVFEVVP